MTTRIRSFLGHSMRAIPRVVIACTVAGLVGFGTLGCGAGTSTPETSLVVGPAGGTLTVSSGPLAGAILDIPPGALERDTRVEIFPVGVIPVGGFADASFALEIRPPDLVLQLPATLTVPYSSGGAPGTPQILGWNGQGPVLETGPTSVDFVEELVVLQITTFQRYWAALRQFLGFQIDLSFLPAIDGNTWTFTEDLSLTLNARSDVPNLDGLSVNELLFTRGDDEFGFYLLRDFADGYLLVGSFFDDAEGSRQFVHDEMRFLLNRVTVEQVALETLPTERFVPIGATTAASTDILAIRSSVTRPEVPFFTPLGGFDNVVRLNLEFEITTDDGEAEVVDFMIDFQDDFGPARVEAFGVVHEVTGAEQFGNPVDPPLPPKGGAKTLTGR